MDWRGQSPYVLPNSPSLFPSRNRGWSTQLRAIFWIAQQIDQRFLQWSSWRKINQFLTVDSTTRCYDQETSNHWGIWEFAEIFHLSIYLNIIIIITISVLNRLAILPRKMLYWLVWWVWPILSSAENHLSNWTSVYPEGKLHLIHHLSLSHHISIYLLTPSLLPCFLSHLLILLGVV